MNKLSGLSIFLLLFLLTGFTSVPLQAAPLQVVQDDDFGRLFSSSGERKKLDILRKNQKLIVAGPQKSLQPEPMADELPEPITLQGYVKRSDGSTTLWVNNKPVQENSAQDEIEIGQLSKQNNSAKNGSDSLHVRIPATGKNVRLKAGQVYEPETGQIKELKLLEKEKQLGLEEIGVISNATAP